jgi:hypothetical protein
MQTRMRGLRSTSAAMSLVLALSAATVPLVAQQTTTLADLALKERERRQALKVRATVITEADLPRMPAASVQLPAPAPVPAAKTPALSGQAAAAGQTGESKDEAWWRQRIAFARDDLRRSDILAEALQTRLNVLASDIASRDDPHQRARLAGDREKALAELERLKSAIELQKHKIGEIEEEARRAGVPPGWLR